MTGPNLTPRQMIDVPPVWLLAAITIMWLQARWIGGIETGVLGLWIGRGFICAGLGLMVAALWEFRRAKTTPIPHHVPDAMITTGVFGLTRNPIYLGDVLILCGLGISFGALSVVVVLPGFIRLIDARFISAEEMRLARTFPDSFPAYKTSVRRWI